MSSATRCLQKKSPNLNVEPRDILIKETARIMGYDRTGVNVEKRINKAVGLLIKEGKAYELNNQIVLAKKE